MEGVVVLVWRLGGKKMHVTSLLLLENCSYIKLGRLCNSPSHWVLVKRLVLANNLTRMVLRRNRAVSCVSPTLKQLRNDPLPYPSFGSSCCSFLPLCPCSLLFWRC